MIDKIENLGRTRGPFPDAILAAYRASSQAFDECSKARQAKPRDAQGVAVAEKRRRETRAELEWLLELNGFALCRTTFKALATCFEGQVQTQNTDPDTNFGRWAPGTLNRQRIIVSHELPRSFRRG